MTKYRILLLDTKPSNPNHYICLGILDALKNHPSVEFVYLATFGDAVSAAKNHHCNLFFAFDGEGLHFELCRRLKEVCGYSILWVTEDPYELHVNLQAIDLFDKVFTNDSGSVSAYGNKGIHLPLAASKYIQYHPVQEDDKYLYDLFFAGTAWPNRVELIRKISTLLDGKIKLKLAMPTNQYLPEIKNIPYPLSFYNWRTSNLEFARFANRSRITLGLHRDFSATPGSTSMALTPGPRVFEVAMAGGFQLIDRSLAEIDRYFISDTEIVTFDSQKECLEKIQYFLANPRIRIEIAKAAQQRALQSHRYTNRIDDIFEVIGADLPFKQNTLVIGENKTRPRVLFVSHNVLGGHDWGGIEVYQEALRKKLKKEFEVYFLVPSSMWQVKEYKLLNEDLSVIESFCFDTPYHDNMISCPDRERAYSEMIARHNFELVHVHHLLSHSPTLILIAKALGVPVIYTWHDYFGICKNYNLIPSFKDAKPGSYCRFEDKPINQCDLCLYASERIPEGSQGLRKEHFYRFFNALNVLHYPTADVKKRVHQFYGPFDGSVQELVLGIPCPDPLKSNPPKEINPRLQVVIFGNLSYAKGANFLLDLIRGFNNRSIDFHLYGRIDPLIREKAYEVIRDVGNFFYHGSYTPSQEISLILWDKDIAIFASRWPETYSIALSEVVNAGVVPIAPSLGSFGERITHEVNGYLYPPDDSKALIERLESLIKDSSPLDSLRKNLRGIPVMSEHIHLEEIANIYRKLMVSKNHVQQNFPIQPFSVLDCGLYLNAKNWYVYEGRQEAAKPLQGAAKPLSMVDLQARIKAFYKRHGFWGSLTRVALGHDRYHYGPSKEGN